MTISEDIAELERALEARPTKGSWSTPAYIIWSGSGDAWAPVHIQKRGLMVQCKREADASYIAACSPDRIRRVLDALVEGESQHLETLSELGMQRTATQVAEAKLSKAIELLREAREWPPLETRQAIDSFLKEQGEPK